MQLYSDANIRQLIAIKLRFLRNNREFWRRYRVLVYLLVIASALDLIFTMHFMKLNGIHDEVHPHIWILSSWLGTTAGPLLGKILQLAFGLMVTIYVVRWAKLILWVGILMYCYAFFHNLNTTDSFNFIANNF